MLLYEQVRLRRSLHPGKLIRYCEAERACVSTSARQIRTFDGTAILSFGFRPFFLAAALWAAIVVALSLPMLTGSLSLPTAFSPLEWHAHEMLYGFLPAVVAGFLLTAVPGWTGRRPIAGMPLLLLVLIWVAGRMAMLASTSLGGAWLSAIADLAFLASLSGVVGREIVAGRDKRNLGVLGLVGLLFAGNAIFHVEAALGTADGYGIRVGIATAVLLISLIGGRIIPLFTRNWLMKQPPGRMPVPFQRYDVAVIVASGVALFSWVAAPIHTLTAVFLLTAGCLQLIRLMRWAGERTTTESIVLVLHVAYAFVPLGFFLVALATLSPDLIAAGGALHAWTAGAIGMMTLAVMTRASLGHTGRALTASWPIALVYATAFVSATTRILAACDIARTSMLYVSAAAWVLAFGGFVAVCWPMLTQPRQDLPDRFAK